jgi:hypothetical protein
MLAAGQNYNTRCPYLWSWCDGGQCDGCEADRGQGNPAATPPWAEGTTIDQRHELVRRAASAPDTRLFNDLHSDPWSWRRYILGTS